MKDVTCKMDIQCNNKPRIKSITRFIYCLLLLVAGCNQPTVTKDPPDWHNVGLVFRRFYQFIGGEEILGPALTSDYMEGASTVQYFLHAKLVFDPTQPAKDRIRLAPVGRIYGFIEPDVRDPLEAGHKYVCGHVIAEKFLTRYEQLGEWVGCPLTEIRFNPDFNRYEQFFENLGFYYSVESVKLGQLNYGKLACDHLCQQHLIVNIIKDKGDGDIEIIGRPHSVFQDAIDYLGTDFTGFALDEAFINPEGNFEQIFENVVLNASSSTEAQSVGVKSLLIYLHWPQEPPKPPSGIAGFHFIPVDGENGFEVPMEMWEYIERHGGLTATGLPISSLNEQSQGEFSQCFYNVCLKFIPSQIEPLKVRTQPLGYVYRNLYRSDIPVGSIQATAIPPRDITIETWARQSAIRPSERQQIDVRITENGLPLADVQPVLKLSLPQGVQEFYFPFTNADGSTSLILNPIIAANGTLISYEVCISGDYGGSFCISDSFVIWDNP